MYRKLAAWCVVVEELLVFLKKLELEASLPSSVDKVVGAAVAHEDTDHASLHELGEVTRKRCDSAFEKFLAVRFDVDFCEDQWPWERESDKNEDPGSSCKRDGSHWTRDSYSPNGCPEAMAYIARRPMISRASSAVAIGRPTAFAICTTRSTRSAFDFA